MDATEYYMICVCGEVRYTIGKPNFCPACGAKSPQVETAKAKKDRERKRYFAERRKRIA